VACRLRRCGICHAEAGKPLPDFPAGQTCGPRCGCPPLCDCPLCYLAGHRGPVPPHVPTARNPAKPPKDEQPEKPATRSLFDGAGDE
jgi:hypothetical protein